MQEQKNQPQNEPEQEITPETVEQFNKVCKEATELMLSYKQQSQDLKNQITSMVTIYNKSASPNDAVPVEKIIQITNTYETQMRSAHNQYEHLEKQLRKEEAERNNMIQEIQLCFGKLEKMEKILKERKAKEKKLAEESKPEIKQQQPNLN